MTRIKRLAAISLTILPTLICSLLATSGEEEPEVNEDEQGIKRISRLLPIFQVVRFPNDACEISGGTKNGTCYTEEECSSRGGTNGGTCAQGFGVCCTFTVGCGTTSSENCTYFEVTSPSAGTCSSRICKSTSNICQIRLDFNTFVITGPSTSSVSVGKQLGGQIVAPPSANAKEVSDATQCQTDTFTVSNQISLPMICGTLTGDHVYFEASDSCNSLDFAFGSAAVGVTAVATRTFSVKVTQYDCNFINLAPPGCDQWYFGSGATGYITSFGHDGTTRHLANQEQTICIRREAGNCRICYSADAASDFNVSLDVGKDSGIITGSICCGYGLTGVAINDLGGYDCIMIPGALKASDSALKPHSICGDKGLVTAKNGASTTVCSKALPFKLTFQSDAFEMSAAASDEGTGGNQGFKLRYFQTAC